MDDQSKNHTKFLILSHLSFACKYRQKLLVSLGNEVKQLYEEIAARSAFSFETRRAWIKIMFIARLRANLASRRWLSCGD
jgi:REP element-mobilizing transposase RayT